jgi:hypothetical protein
MEKPVTVFNWNASISADFINVSFSTEQIIAVFAFMATDPGRISAFTGTGIILTGRIAWFSCTQPAR